MAWWRKAVHLMAARKQRGQEESQREREELSTEHIFQRHTPSSLLPLIVPHPVVVPSAMNYLNETSTLRIQLPSESPTSEHKTLCKDIWIQIKT